MPYKKTLFYKWTLEKLLCFYHLLFPRTCISLGLEYLQCQIKDIEVSGQPGERKKCDILNLQTGIFKEHIIIEVRVSLFSDRQRTG